MIEESNKLLVFKYSSGVAIYSFLCVKYSTGVAVIEITIKEMPFSLSIAYLIKVGRLIMKFHDETEEGLLSENYFEMFVCVTPVIAVYE